MKQYERLFESAWPYVLGALPALVWYWGFNGPFPVPSAPLLGAALTATAVVVGFLATAKAVMLGVATSDVFQRLKAAGFTGSLFRYLFEAIWAGMFFLVFSVFGFFLDAPNTPLPPWYTQAWVLLGSIVVLLFARITRILFILLSKA